MSEQDGSGAPNGSTEAIQSYLRECALLVVGALRPGDTFPTDFDGVVALIQRAAEPEPRPPETPRFAAEPADELPRFTGRGAVWVSPAGEGALRLRAEDGFLSSTSVILRPDGWLGEFTRATGFGVPDSELTERARSDFELVNRRRIEDEADDLHHVEEGGEDERFGNGHLIAVRVAPPQSPSGLVVTWIALYDTGVIVNFLLPRPADTESGRNGSDTSAHGIPGPTLPGIELRDHLGTTYAPVGSSEPDLTSESLRGSVQFTPAVPPEASLLLVRGEWGSVEIGVEQ